MPDTDSVSKSRYTRRGNREFENLKDVLGSCTFLSGSHHVAPHVLTIGSDRAKDADVDKFLCQPGKPPGFQIRRLQQPFVRLKEIKIVLRENAMKLLHVAPLGHHALEKLLCIVFQRSPLQSHVSNYPIARTPRRGMMEVSRGPDHPAPRSGELAMTVSIHDLREFRKRGEKFAMVTAYDFPSARICDEANIPVILVGDSLAQVVLGYPTTLPVTMDEMLHHARAVARGSKNALLVGDLPFGSYQAGTDDAVRNSVAYLQAGMHAVKLEGPQNALVDRLTADGIPVMGHLGLTPQSVNALGGYRVQGRGESGDRLLTDALALQEAGIFALVLEAVPAELGGRVTDALEIPTIGIGAGPQTDGQVLVWHDLLGITTGPAPRFVKRYAQVAQDSVDALRAFAKEIAEGTYPSKEHTYD